MLIFNSRFARGRRSTGRTENADGKGQEVVVADVLFVIANVPALLVLTPLPWGVGRTQGQEDGAGDFRAGQAPVGQKSNKNCSG